MGWSGRRIDEGHMIIGDIDQSPGQRKRGMLFKTVAL